MTTTFHLKRGQEIKINYVSSFLIAKVTQAVRKEFVAKHGELTPPTYKLRMGGGPYGEWEEEYEHDANTITDAMPDDKKAWKKYLALQRELNAAVWEKQSRLYLLEGIVDDPPDDGWDQQQEKYGVEVPVDLDERKLHWIETELLTDRGDLFMLIAAIQGRSEEAQRVAQDAARVFQH